MFYPARWKKITVDQSKVLKNWLYRLFRLYWATRNIWKFLTCKGTDGSKHFFLSFRSKQLYESFVSSSIHKPIPPLHPLNCSMIILFINVSMLWVKQCYRVIPIKMSSLCHKHATARIYCVVDLLFWTCPVARIIFSFLIMFLSE